ncbi:gamma carbonic anhydrase family protein [Arthrobacter sp. NPDC057013]|uniref:gamma carbonic anhydrase family protein n=1 Tax=Arthrobacter sp. NPDC057013 TaxID=3345999 RepID=UPI003632F1FA
MLHGCTVGEGALIGMNATVLNGADVGKGSLVAANALVPEGMRIPPGSLVAGVPAKVRRSLTQGESCADCMCSVDLSHAATWNKSCPPVQGTRVGADSAQDRPSLADRPG